HNPKASIDGGEQPHAHIMMSQRINDGMERSPEQYFRRTFHTIVNTLAHHDMRMRLFPSVNARFWIVNGKAI
ncbi:hypothetical protein MU767_23775, partial [Salmonella enterica subsp. enterica serovar Enteritidis]|nr:hypothetical protein [Salmonella enterica subsp. enterica serovar Enteritidis]